MSPEFRGWRNRPAMMRTTRRGTIVGLLMLLVSLVSLVSLVLGSSAQAAVTVDPGPLGGEVLGNPVPAPGPGANVFPLPPRPPREPGFAELKRSLRELPQLRALGVAEDEVGVVQEWEAGSRRLKR